MLETLIALFILMIALLALATVQARALLYAQDAQLRSKVQLAVQRLAASLAANRNARDAYIEHSYSSVTSTSAFCEGTAFCSPQQQAQADLAQFKQALRLSANAAAQVQGLVCRASLTTLPTLSQPHCQAQGTLSIRVVWRAPAGTSSAWQEYAYVLPVFLPE